MFMPTIFHENLFDDFFDPFWNDGALERAMNREERETFGKRGANMMKTDVKQTTDGSYDVAVDLPGCKKEDVQMELNDGYLTIQAVRSHSNDEKDNNGRYIRHEVATVEMSYPITWSLASALFILYYVKGGWMQRCAEKWEKKQAG